MINFAEGWGPDPPITQEMASAFLQKLFAEPNSMQASHIAQYIHQMMYKENYKLLDLTITKDPTGNLVFELINKEK